MSGNTVTAAADIETRRWSEAVIHALPSPCFVAGVALGTRIGACWTRRAVREGFAPTLALEACALAGFALLARTLPASTPAHLTP